ncbi:hypothetical protein V8G54_012477 [Vigna mungo]|uniref:Uncharacterized protein n=1 Tax=Vigna mungo TaxID=3915 RepID=A0AAQ3S3U8_VIGMU
MGTPKASPKCKTKTPEEETEQKQRKKGMWIDIDIKEVEEVVAGLVEREKQLVFGSQIRKPGAMLAIPVGCFNSGAFCQKLITSRSRVLLSPKGRVRNNDVGSQVLVLSDATSTRGMGVEMKVVIENKEDLVKEHVESGLPKSRGYKQGVFEDIISLRKVNATDNGVEVDTHRPVSGNKRDLAPKQGVKKYKKKLKVELLDHGGGVTLRRKSSNLGGLKGHGKDNELKLVEKADLTTLVQGMLEFQSRFFDRRLTNLLQKELVDEDKTKMDEELVVLQKETFEDEIKKLKTQNKQKDVKEENEALKKKLKAQQAEFLYQEVTSKDLRFNIIKDIFEGRMLDEIMTTKIVQNVVVVENVGKEFGKETIRSNPSVPIDPAVKDEDNEYGVEK